MKVFEKAPAKINLSLDVLGKRPDGYHEVEMVMTTIDLADRLSLEEREADEVTLESTSGFLPLDQRNLAVQAALLLKERYRVTRGLHIVIHKRIPISAGLAGGSSDAAAVLRGLNRLWQLGLSLEELAEAGAEIGSDVPFCVHGGTALATGRGEKITPLPDMMPVWAVLAKLPLSVSTEEVYRQLNLDRSLQRPDTRGMIRAIEARDFDGVCAAMGNVLEDVTFSLYPPVACLKQCMRRSGAKAALMSGSGPTVYALEDRFSRAQRLYNGLRGFCQEVYAVRILTRKYASISGSKG